MRWIKYGLLTLLALIAFAAIVLLLMGRRADAGRIQTSIEIGKPPAEVWAWLEEPDKFRKWVSWVVDVKDEGPSGVGGKRTVKMQDPNAGGEIVEMHSVLKVYEPHKRMTVHLSSPIGFFGDMEYVLEDLGNGRTRLSTDGRWTYTHWFAALMEPLVTPQAKAKGDDDFRRLKQLMEQL